MSRLQLAIIVSAGCVFLLLFACSAAENGDGDDDDTSNERDAATDTDTDTDTDADTDTDTDTDQDAGPDDGGVINMDCSSCSPTGPTTDDLICAFDLCDPSIVIQNNYNTLIPVGTGCTVEDTYEAVNHFGNTTNGLLPKLNGSYALMGSGPVAGVSHSTQCDDGSGSLTDPFSSDGLDIHDVFEWQMVLQAPDNAEGIRFKYVFFSEEYDDFIGTDFNDKFYVVLESGSTNGGAPTVINFTECRDQGPGAYFDFECQTGDPGCTPGQKYCYIAINTALSECCWYAGCPGGPATTDITGTGFECAANQGSDSDATGSSTGWLQTAWPIEAGENFAITFHVHDTSDGVYDSMVILDSFQFLKTPEQGTVPIE